MSYIYHIVLHISHDKTTPMLSYMSSPVLSKAYIGYICPFIQDSLYKVLSHGVSS